MTDKEVELFLLEALKKENAPMSREDGVYITTSQPDAIGVYEDAGYAQQVAYSNNAAVQQQFGNPANTLFSANYSSDPGSAALGTPFLPLTSPGYQVVQQGQRTTADANGNLIHY